MSVYIKIIGVTSSFITFAKHNRNGVYFAKGVSFNGLPIIDNFDRESSISIGTNCSLVSQSISTALGVRSPIILRTLASGASIQIGSDTGLSGTAVCAAESVTIGNRCLIGADCMIFDTDFHGHEIGDGQIVEYRRYRKPDWKSISSPVVIGDDVFLGTRVIVTKGVNIGNGSVIAAGSVVSRDIPAGCVAAGSPAKPIRRL